MIKPKTGSEKTNQNFVVTDIENNKDGSLLAIGTSFRNPDGEIIHVRHSTWDEYWKWLTAAAETLECFRTVYAHNGGGWDWHGLAYYLMIQKKHPYHEVGISRVMSKIVTMNVRVREKFIIRFCDSLYLLRSPLDKLGKKFFGKGKSEVSGKMAWELYHENRQLFDEYLKRDCELLILVLEKSLELLREHIAKIDRLGITIGATAIDVFRTGFLEREISIPVEPEIKDFLRRGYRGGRVEVFRAGYHARVNVYDVNSLYPTAMCSTLIPISADMSLVYKFDPKKVGVYKIKFEQYNRKILPVLIGDDGLGIYEGVGYFFSPELCVLKQYDPHCKIDVEWGYVFNDVGKPFDRFVNSLYDLRKTDYTGPLGELCKFLLNSCYGKFAQRGEREKLLLFYSNDDFIAACREGRNIADISPDSPFSVETIFQPPAFEHVGIAGIITSKARAILYEHLSRVPKSSVIYADTDSVHTTDIFPSSFVGRDLGQLKLEFSGEGIYCGKKLYCLRDLETKTEKIRAKGVSVGGRNGASLNWDSFLRMAKGEKIVCSFSQPATIMQVLRGEQPNRIGNLDGSHNRKRTLKMTVKNAK